MAWQSSTAPDQGDRLETPDHAAFSVGGQITLCAWFRNFGTVTNQGGIAFGKFVQKAVTTGSPRNWGYAMGLDGTGNGVQVPSGIISWTDGTRTVVTGTTDYGVAAKGSTWHHMALTYDGAVVRLLVDAVTEGSVSVSAKTVQPTPSGAVSGNFMLLGNDWTSIFVNHFPGAVADVALWNTHLENRELSAMARGVVPLFFRPAHLRVYFPLRRAAAPEDDYGPFRLQLTTIGGVTRADHAPTQFVGGPVTSNVVVIADIMTRSTGLQAIKQGAPVKRAGLDGKLLHLDAVPQEALIDAKPQTTLARTAGLAAALRRDWQAPLALAGKVQRAGLTLTVGLNATPRLLAPLAFTDLDAVLQSLRHDLPLPLDGKLRLTQVAQTALDHKAIRVQAATAGLDAAPTRRTALEFAAAAILQGRPTARAALEAHLIRRWTHNPRVTGDIWTRKPRRIGGEPVGG